MRALSAKTSAAIAQPVTAPRLLIEIGWSHVVRLCTRETVAWQGRQWIGPQGRISGLGGNNADQQCDITLSNHDSGYGAIALSEGLSDKSVKIYALYGDAPYTTDDAALLFDGQLDGGTVTAESVDIHCIAMRGVTMYAPRIYAQPPVVNHAPPAGTVLRWNGDNYTLERR
jgi:hypothetical protein